MPSPSLKVVDKPVYNGPIFDADTHIQEKDWSFFPKYLPQNMRDDWSVAVKQGPEGYGLYIGNNKCLTTNPREDGKVPPPGKLKEWLAAIASGKEVGASIEPTPDMYIAEERVKKLDEFGVESAIMFIGQFVSTFGTLGVLAREQGPQGPNAVLHAYNQMFHEEWGFNRDNRVYPTAVLSLWDLEHSLKEADWLIKNGVRVVVMPMGPANGRSPADPYFDPLWSKLNEAGVVVTFHVSDANFMHGLIREWGEEPLQSRRKGQTAWQWMFAYSEIPVMMTMANFVYWNFFERFPNIKIASVENGAEWLPRFLYKMDKMRGMARSGYWPAGQLKERPSTIFKQNCFVVAYPEDNLAEIAEALDGDVSCLLMGSDYPHAEGVPTPRDFVAEACSGLSDDQIRQIMYDNGRRMVPKS